MSYQDLQINLTGRDVSASDALRGLARAANQAAKSAGASLDEMNRKVEQSADRATAAARKTSQSFTSELGGNIGKWASGGLQGILAGVAASVTSSVTSVVGDAGSAILTQLKSSVVDYSSLLENANIGFTTMLGSGEKATAFLKELQDFAQRTPFDTGQLVQLAQQMQGYGIAAKNVIPYLTAIGDASSSAGKMDQLPNAVLAFEQMAARSRVDLQDVNQLTQAGVPALKIWAGELGTTRGKVLELIHTGHLMSSQMLPALIRGIEEGTAKTPALGGEMAKQSHTFVGAMSNIGDATNRVLSTAFSPFYGVLEKLANKVVDFAQSRDVQQWAEDTEAAVGRFFDRAQAGVSAFFDDPRVQTQLGQLWSNLSDLVGGAGDTVSHVLPDFLEFGQEVLPGITSAVDTLDSKWPELSSEIQGVASDLAATGKQWGDFISWVATATGTVADLISNLQHLRLPGSNLDLRDALGSLNGMTGSGTKQWGGGSGLFGSSTVTASADSLDRKSTATPSKTAFPKFSISKLLGGGGSGGGGRGSADTSAFANLQKLFTQTGRDAGHGLSEGLLGSKSEIQSAADKIVSAIEAAFKGGKISHSAEKAGIDAVDTMAKRLQSLSAQRADVEDQLKQARSSRKSLVSDIEESTADADGIGKPGFTSGGMLQGLQAMIHDAGTFKSNLQTLARRGIDGTTFRQLVKAWQSDPQAALAGAQELIANPTDMRQIVSLQGQLAKSATALGDYAAGQEYDGDIARLRGRDRVTGWQMQQAARAGLRRAGGDTHVHVNINGHYTGTKDDLAKTIKQVIQDAVKRGTIPKNWAAA